MSIDVILPQETMMPNEGRIRDEPRVIYNFIPIERNLCFTIQELQAFINHYPYGQRHRLCFLIMATAGLRTAEAVNIRLDSFLKEDFTEFKYQIAKAKVRVYTDTGTKVVNIKTRVAKIPRWVADELKYYIERNYHLFEDGQVFPFTADTLRRFFNWIRQDARDGKISDPVLTKSILEKTGESICIGTKKPAKYRLSLHSFRRFYLTYIYHAVYERDISQVQRDIGHDLKQTTYGYVYKPDNIGLTEELKDRNKEFLVLTKCSTQQRLSNFEK